LAGAFGFGYPTIRYAPLLLDNNGEKICSSKSEHKKFQLTQVTMDSNGPDSLIEKLLKCHCPDAEHVRGEDPDEIAIRWCRKLWTHYHGLACLGQPMTPIKFNL
jgi:hypothetical protein